MKQGTYLRPMASFLITSTISRERYCEHHIKTPWKSSQSEQSVAKNLIRRPWSIWPANTTAANIFSDTLPLKTTTHSSSRYSRSKLSLLAPPISNALRPRDYSAPLPTPSKDLNSFLLAASSSPVPVMGSRLLSCGTSLMAHPDPQRSGHLRSPPSIRH
jgi:hypothetical protein